MKERAVFAFDIDQTLAGGVVPAHMRHYNKVFGWNMTETDFEASAQYAKTFDHPLIKALREIDEPGFQKARGEVRTSELVHISFNTLPGSIEAAYRIVQSTKKNGMNYFGGYYTVRPEILRPATINWLDSYHAPFSERVVICDSPKDKIERLIIDWGMKDEDGNYPAIVLFDDSHKDLVNAANDIVTEDPDMKQLTERLVIVGYGDTKLSGAFYPMTGLRVLSLPTFAEKDIKNFEVELTEQTGVRI